MKFLNLLIIIIICSLSGASCQPKNKETIIVITTSYGDIKLKLYNETPIHRNNFIKLINQGYFKDKIFHRVIQNFMIQGGMDPKGTVNNDTIPAEINPMLFHKKGALAAARKGDEINPTRASTASQFYIVQGQKFTQEQLRQIQESINMQLIQMTARKYYFNLKKEYESKHLSYDEQTLIPSVIEKAKKENELKPYKFSANQIQTYTTIGGTPHLDGNYTVFGEAIDGMNVVDSIASVKTLPGDKPEKDVIFSIRILK